MSPFEYMKEGWALFSRGSDMQGADALYGLLIDHGIRPKEFLIYGDNRTFLISQQLDTSRTLAFHRGHLIGDIEDVRAYLSAKEQPLENDPV